MNHLCFTPQWYTICLSCYTFKRSFELSSYSEKHNLNLWDMSEDFPRVFRLCLLLRGHVSCLQGFLLPSSGMLSSSTIGRNITFLRVSWLCSDIPMRQWMRSVWRDGLQSATPERNATKIFTLGPPGTPRYAVDNGWIYFLSVSSHFYINSLIFWNHITQSHNNNNKSVKTLQIYVNKYLELYSYYSFHCRIYLIC